MLDKADLPRSPEIVRDLKHILSERFDIHHSTIEVETQHRESAAPES